MAVLSVTVESAVAAASAEKIASLPLVQNVRGVAVPVESEFQFRVVVTVDQLPVAFAPVVPVGSQYCVAARAAGAGENRLAPANNASVGRMNRGQRTAGYSGSQKIGVESGVETAKRTRRLAPGANWGDFICLRGTYGGGGILTDVYRRV